MALKKKSKSKREFFVYEKGKCVTKLATGAKRNDSRTDKKRVGNLVRFDTQMQLFLYLYETRGPYSEISGKRLLPPTHEFFHWQFEHILPKGLYKRFELYPKNILLCLPEEHTFVGQHEGDARRDQNWNWYFEIKEILKQEYHARKRLL